MRAPDPVRPGRAAGGRGPSTAGRARGVVGRALVASAAITASFAAAVWFGWVPIAPEGRPLVAGVLLVVTVLDLLVGFRFMGEPGD